MFAYYKRGKKHDKRQEVTVICSLKTGKNHQKQQEGTKLFVYYKRQQTMTNCKQVRYLFIYVMSQQEKRKSLPICLLYLTTHTHTHTTTNKKKLRLFIINKLIKWKFVYFTSN